MLKILASFFVTIKEFAKLFEFKSREKLLDNLKDLDVIGETQIISINNFFTNITNTKITKELIKELDIKNYTTPKLDGKPNKKLMFTGGFKNISRSEAKAIAENNGGKVLGSFQKT